MNKNILELLDKKIINQYLSPKHKDFANKLIILDEIHSTNTYLAECAKNQATDVKICFAESQTAGKGRSGRPWFSPYAQNIYLSLLWDFTKDPSELAGLSLAIGVVLVEALKSYGIKKNIFLKWPNDIFWQNRKLAGVLIEFCGKAHNTYQTIIGVGLNVNMSQPTDAISQPWCNIAQIINTTPQRNKLAGLLLDKLLPALALYQKHGLKPFLKKWHKLDITYGKKVTIITSQQQKIPGIGCGINDQGYFLLKDRDGKIQTFAVGEVSMFMSP